MLPPLWDVGQRLLNCNKDAKCTNNKLLQCYSAINAHERSRSQPPSPARKRSLGERFVIVIVDVLVSAVLTVAGLGLLVEMAVQEG